MKRRLVVLSVFVTVALAIVGYGAYEFGMRRGMSTMASPSAAQPAQATGSERKVLYWHDPMVPGVRFDKPGKSPYMDMELVPVYADEVQNAGITVAPGMVQSLGIRTATVRKGSLAGNVEAIGTVAQNERATVMVQSRVSGFVEKLYVRATLDPVARGQSLVTIFAPEWSGALSEYLGLRRANVDPAILAAARERLRLLSIPDDVVVRSEHEGTAQSRFTLVSPISGVVTELGVREGVMVQPGMALFRIVDLSTVWVEANIAEAQAAQVREGAAAQARSDAYPGRTFSGKVGALLPQVDVTTRTLRARVELQNPGTVLKPGMFVSVTLGTPSAETVLLVPQEAVIATGRRNVVIVAGDDNRFLPADITTGRPVGSDIEVKAGLSEGQRIVTSGQFLIDSEASLKSVMSRLEAMPGTAARGADGAGEHSGHGAKP
jgi:Cu(I)/Ag(I) efflux system membrane fusion protein